MTYKPSQLLTPDEVADRLNVHVKTVRRYIREGQLQSVQIGKRHRVTTEALAAFVGVMPPDSLAPVRAPWAEVSAVVILDDVEQAQAIDISRHLTAATQARSSRDQPLLVETLHNPENRRLKVIVSGSITATTVILGMIELLAARSDSPGED